MFVFSDEQSSQPKLEVFQELLSKHPSVFYPSRTPKSLLVHWQLLKQYYLLEDQSGEKLKRAYWFVTYALYQMPPYSHSLWSKVVH